MIQQLSLFTGQQKKQLGQQSVLRHASDFWKEEALAVLIKFVSLHGEITSDDLRGICAEPENSNSWGAIFSAASKMKIIKNSGRYIISKIPSCQGRRIAVWTKA